MSGLWRHNCERELHHREGLFCDPCLYCTPKVTICPAPIVSMWCVTIVTFSNCGFIMGKEQEEFGRRLQDAMDLAGWPARGRAPRLQRLTGMSVAAARKWVNGESIPNVAELKLIAAELSVEPHYLQWGPAIDNAVSEHKTIYREPSNVEGGPEVRGLIPEISYVQAGEWAACEDPYPVGGFLAEHATTMACGPGTFALRVRGDSMLNDQGVKPSYSDGDIIICDPTQRAGVSTKDRVIALLDDETLTMERRVTFKMIVFDGPDVWLAPINKDPKYRIMREPFQVIAKVLHSIVY